MEWKIEDSTPQWLKVRNDAGRVYFITWEMDPVFVAMDILPLIPADSSEGRKFVVPVARGELPREEEEGASTAVLWDPGLIKLWRRERLKHQQAGLLQPLAPAPKGRRHRPE